MQRLDVNNKEITAIIGFGMSGLSEFCSYVDAAIQNHKKPTILIFEKNERHFATGLPFNQDTPSIWLLNGPPAEAFKVPEHAITLLQWIRDNHAALEKKFGIFEERFPPRALIGDYLKAQYDIYKQKALQNGIQVVERHEEVTNLEMTDQKQLHVHTPSGSMLVDYVSLGVGNLLPDHFQELKGKPGFIDNPWDTNQLKTLPDDAKEIVIIGGHLTFIDTVKYLVLNQHFQGNFICATRHPSMIAVRETPVDIDKKPMTDLLEIYKAHKSNKLTLQQSTTHFSKTYRESVKQPIQENTNISDSLALQLAAIDNPDHDCLPRTSMSEVTSFLLMFFDSGTYKAMWESLDENSQEEFLKHYYSKVYSYLIGIPPINARLLMELYQNNRIQEMSGMNSLKFDEKAQEYILRFNDGSEKHTKYVINGTGQGKDITRHFDQLPLLEKLIQNGIITVTKFGGIITNEYSQVISSNGAPIPNVIAVGPSVFKGAPSGEASLFIAALSENAAQEHFRSVMQP